MSLSSSAPHLGSTPTHDAPPVSPAAESPVDRLVQQAPLVVLLLSVAVALSHLLLGPNFVLDDFFNVHEGILGGPLSATTAELAASRPGVSIAYGITFGVFGNHPLPIVIVASLVNIASAQLLLQTARQYLNGRVALALAAFWVVLPNHMALEIWPSTIMISMSLLFALTTINLLGREGVSRSAILIFAFASSAFYEGSLPLVCLAILVVPKIRRGAIDTRLLLGGIVSQGALAGWVLLNLPPSKAARDFIAPRDVIGAFYGAGLVPPWFEAISVSAFLVSFAVLGFVAFRDRRFEAPEKLVAAGFVIMAASVVPYLRYFFTPVGAGDRLQYLSSIGGAATIIGLFWAAGRSKKLVPILGVVAASGMVLLVINRVDGTRAWNQAGDDGVRILELVEAADLDRTKPVVLGPEPVFYRGVTPFLDPSNVRPAMATLFDDPTASGFITFDEEAFLDEPEGQRVDIGPAVANE